MDRVSNPERTEARHAPGLAASILAITAFMLLVGTAEAKPARCFTTDDGKFSCDIPRNGPRWKFCDFRTGQAELSSEHERARCGVWVCDVGFSKHRAARPLRA